ncbi:MAG TPA: efflux RND transporter permease subunit, partial [Longimicrobiaceae bacterium]|nr:efflux RND transporter permease subunit [Longimicrobiaceae bacterium]
RGPVSAPRTEPRAERSGEGRRRSGLPSLAIRRPIGTVMLTTVVLVLGGYFLSGLPLDLLPSISYPQVRASVTNPGVEPEVMEETVAKPLEAALAVTEGVTRIETEVQEGRVGVNLFFDYGTDVDLALQDAAKNLERARARLPEEADPPTIFKFDPSQIPVYEVAFSSPTRSLIDLRDWVDQRLRPQLLTLEGVASVDVSGGLQREVQVVLDQERLRSYGLTVAQVTSALRAANQNVAAGRVASPTFEVVGKTAGKFRSVGDIRGTLLVLGNGARIPLSEVATVSDTSREQRLYARLNGVPAVRLSVRKQPDANTVAVADAVNEKLASLQGSAFFPADIEYRTLENQANFIRNSVGSVRNAAIGGALLAMIVVFLFLGSLRKTFVIGLAIPIAIFATFLMMGMGNLTLNIMSLGGLALGVGLLIDNSIVMLENIFRHTKKAEGEGLEEAAHEGAAEVQTAVVASTTTNLAAVVPFLLISGLTALLFRELILTISFAILASLLVALTLVPMMSAQFGKVRFTSGLAKSRLIRGFDRGVGRLRDGYRRAAPRVLRWRWLVLGGAVASFFAVIPLVSGLGNEFLPQVDDGGVSVGISLPPGSTPTETNRIALEIEEMVREMPHVQHVFASAGGMFFGSATVESGGRGSLGIRLAPPSEREMTADEWVQALQQKINERGYAGARIFVRPPRIRGLRTSSSGEAVAVTIQGDDLRELQAIAEEVMARIREVPGLEAVQPSTEEASPQIAVELDRERAASMGLDVAAVGQALRTALDGTVATRYTEGNREYGVRVMFPRERFTSPEDLESVALFPAGAGGAPVYLRDVATVRPALGPSTILRENQNRVLRVTGDVITDVATVGEVMNGVRARLADLRLPDGYGILYGGEEEAIRENSRQLTVVVSLAIFLVFVVMAVQYESLINPFVILLAIPLSMVGVALALRLTGTPLGAPVMLGVILLAGIVVNNAILLVEYIEEFRRVPGTSMLDAAVDAGAVRLRPILMTTLTTMFGMIPLALGLGEGSELMQPLAVAMIGGLSLSTLLTLFVVPSAYVVFNSLGDRVKGWLTGGGRERRELREEPAAPAPTPERDVRPLGEPVPVGGD